MRHPIRPGEPQIRQSLRALLKRQAQLAELDARKRRARLSSKSSPRSPRFHRSNKSWLTIRPPSPPPVDPWSMTPDQATRRARGNRCAIHPPPSVSPGGCSRRPRQLGLARQRNTCGLQSLFQGHVATRRSSTSSWPRLAGGDDVGDAVAGIIEPSTPPFETTANGELPRRHVEGTIASLRDSGLNDASIEQAINLPPIIRAEFMQAQALKCAALWHGEWRSKLLSGDHEATRQHNLLCVLLSSPIAEE